MKKGMKLALLLEQHGETLMDCKGCEICERMHFIANEKESDAIKYQKILNKRDGMTLSEVKRLHQKGVDLTVIKEYLGIGKADFIQLTKALGLYKELKINIDIKVVKKLRSQGLGWDKVAEKLGVSGQTLRKIRKSEGWVQIYSKDMQLHENKKPSTRRRNDFSSETREEIKNIWGHCCYVCENPQVELHHVKYRSASGRGTKRNGLPLCHFHHQDHSYGIHHNRKFRNEITELFIDKFGEDFYKDEYDLFAEKKLKEPTKEEMEKYFLKVGIQ